MSANGQYYECSTLPEVAMPFMNRVHCAELSLVGNLLTTVTNSASTESIDSLLAEWIQHTQAHFAREERLMQEYNFFAIVPHQSEHEQALSELLGVQQQWLRDRDPALLLAYIPHWREWLQQHISTMDFVTANFLSRFDITVEL
jgi:hemerythrin